MWAALRFGLTGKIGIDKRFASHLQAMSLIPSESYNFPDHFTRTVVPSRKPKNEAAALRRVSAPPLRIPDAPVRKMPLPPTLKPKVRWNTRAPAMDHPSLTSENGTASVAPIMAAQMQSVPAKPRPAAVSNPRADFFAMLAQTREIAMLAQTRETALSNQRRKMKFHRFIVCESAALGAVLALAIVGVSFHPTNAAVAWIINIFAIASAVTAALIPIIFYAFTPTLPEIER